MKKLSLFIFLFLTFYSIHAQKPSDSLKGKTFDYLFEKFDSSNDILKQNIYSNAIINNAKKEKDSSNLVTGYYLKSYMYSDERVIIYSDSVIDLTKNDSNEYQPAGSYINKGVYYYKIRAFQRAIENIIEAQHYALKYNNTDFIYITNYYIGILKNRMGEHEEALTVLKENYKYAKENKFEKHDFSTTIFALANTYNELKILDSASFYNNLGVKKAIEYNNLEDFNHFRLNQGLTLFYQKKYIVAFDSITKSIPLLIKIDDKPNLAVGYFYLSKIYKEFNDSEKMLINLKKVDTIFRENKDVLPKIREAYEMLINHYKDKKDLKQQLTYVNQLITLDSILHSNEVYINKNIIKEYDIPKLVSEKEQIIKRIKRKDAKKQNIIYIMIVLLVLIIMGFYYQYKKKKLYKERFLNITTNNSTSKVIKPSVLIDFSEGIVQMILKELELFEKNEMYLKSEETIHSLSKKMNTNAKYLSKVINHYKQKPFIHYINELRINYAIDKLKNDLSFRKYTIIAISNEVGFKKAESFSKAFKKVTGITPAFFIKELNKTII